MIRVALAVLAGVVLALGVAIGLRGRWPYLVGVPLATPVAFVYAYTGLLLPWSQLSWTVGQLLVERALSVPIAGEHFAQIFFGGFTLTQSAQEVARAHHIRVLALVCLVVVNRLGFALRGVIQGDRRLPIGS